jgi:hypothetical protein
MINPTQAQLDAGFALLHKKAHESGLPSFLVSDDKLHAFVSEFASAILNAAPAPKAA